MRLELTTSDLRKRPSTSTDVTADQHRDAATDSPDEEPGDGAGQRGAAESPQELALRRHDRRSINKRAIAVERSSSVRLDLGLLVPEDVLGG